jgi:RHS repeat-associated protein
MILAAKEEMHVFPLAACVPSELTGNSYPGHRQPSAVLHQAIAYSKPLYAPGLPTCLYDKGIRSRCTGKERDAESGLDYFGARYFSGAQGRFTSADQPFNDQYPADPQSWNLYAYVRNNPLKFTDFNGEDCVYTNNFSTNGSVTVESGNCSQKGGTFVDGTIDTKSVTYDARSNSLGYTYTNAAAGTGGAGTIGLPDAPTDQLSPGVAAMLHDAGSRASRDTSTFMISSAMLATAYISTYATPAVLAFMADEFGTAGTLANKIHHIFDNAQHNLSGLVQQYGSPAAAYAALEKATAEHVLSKGLTGQFEEVVNVGGSNVTVRGAVVNGVVKIGTAFK